MNAQLLALCKRRGQLKQAIMDIVQLSMGYIPQLAAKADKEELILTLKAVTDGKIYAEVERARVTLALAMIREGEGKVSEASEILQECAVETFGSMEKKEKTELLLEQVRGEGEGGAWVARAFLSSTTLLLTHPSLFPTLLLPTPPPAHRCA